MTVLPAKRLENFAPAFGRKERMRKGFDADITPFDPTKITDMATYQDPLLHSIGIEHVMVNGKFVVKNGSSIEDVLPGQLIKSAK
jgi:N-acyl-D-aspartate/D-glutamate deacylase